METLLRDLRFAVRGLFRTPGFTIAAILALALGIGATTAIFSVVHAVLLRSLGWGEESRLVAVRGNWYGQNLTGIWASTAEYRDLQKSPLFESVGVYSNDTVALQQQDRAERIKAGFATGSFFTALGVRPVYGRTFSGEEDVRGNDGVAILSWAAFRKRYGSDPGAVGRSVTVDGRPRTIVGVLPASFRWEYESEIYLPFGWTQEDEADRSSRGLNPVARLRPSVSLDAARRDLDQLSEQIRQANPKFYPPEGRWALSLQPLRDRFVASARQPLVVLFGAVLLVLLIACANVANLLLARGAARAREIAVRSALGGSRWRIVRQLLTESAVLAAVGALLGVAMAVWALEALLAAAPGSVRQFADVSVSRAVLAFAAAMVIATTFVFGLVPALHTTQLDLAQSLKDGARGTSGPRAGRLRSSLVVAQVALSLMLLVGAGLLLRSFARVLAVNPGFEAQGVLAATVSPSGPGYESKREARAAYFTEALRRLEALPGVTSAGGINVAPLGGRTDRSYEIEGYTLEAGRPGTDDEFREATPGYFKTIGTPVVTGREFAASDDAKAPRVVLVNEAWVRAYFPGRDVIGKRLRYHKADEWRTIVGVVGDSHDFGFDKPTPPVYYVPAAQWPPYQLTFMVRTSLPANLVREALTSVDATQPVDRVEPFADRISGALAARRFPLQLLGLFAGLALVLSALGIYGVTAYGVTQRTQEIGVRIAIGAQRGDVLRMIMGGALKLAALGVAIGLFAALLGGQILASQLYGVSARDPLTFAAIPVLLALVALVASFLPARKAASVDPMSALRTE
ncbi:MAG: ABC transporter permease [Myxococcales bacterium]|nr:ABC transporter permease [Myxococcales bacterium]